MTNNIVSTKDIWKWVGLGWCTTCCGLGWVGFVLWWVGLGFKKLTHVHVCLKYQNRILKKIVIIISYHGWPARWIIPFWQPAYPLHLCTHVYFSHGK